MEHRRNYQRHERSRRKYLSPPLPLLQIPLASMRGEWMPRSKMSEELLGVCSCYRHHTACRLLLAIAVRMHTKTCFSFPLPFLCSFFIYILCARKKRLYSFKNVLGHI